MANTIHRLVGDALHPYLLLLEPGQRQRLLDGQADPTQIVLGRSFWGTPVGVAVANLGEATGWLTDLYVLPEYRRSGIGTSLLDAVEAHVRQADLSSLKTLYRHEEGSDPFDALLVKQGWTDPRGESHVFWTRCAVGVGPWVRHYRFRPPYSVFPWSELTPAERERLTERGEAGWYPPILSPFFRPDKVWDDQTSIGLRYKGEVVGWCLTVREKSDQMLVEIMFVDPPLQRLGRGFMLVGEVIRRYCASGGDYAYWRVSPENEPMLRWSRKAFAGEGLVDQYEEWTSKKALGEG